MFKIKFKSQAKIKSVFRPTRVWRWLMGIFLVLVFAAFGGGYFSYKQLSNLEVSSQRWLEKESAELNRLDLKTLTQVRAEFEAKARQTENLKLNPPPIVNLALPTNSSPRKESNPH